MTISTLFDGLGRPVVWALVHFLWQGTLVALAAAVGLWLLRRRDPLGHDPGSRYGLAVSGLLLMAILPVVTALHLASSSPANEGGVPGVVAGALATDVASNPATDGARTGPGVAPDGAALGPWASDAWGPWLLAAWLLGVLGLGVVHAGGFWRAQTLRWNTRTADAQWRQRLESLCQRLDIDRPVALLESSRAAVPFVLGWLRPAVVVPAGAFVGLAPQQLEAVLAHELAHVRRHDYLVNLFQMALETLLFFHPGVWWLSRQARIEREACCDDLAVRACGEPLVLARALAKLEDLRSAAPMPALGAGDGALLDRIRRLVGRPSNDPMANAGSSGSLGASLGGALVAALVATAAVLVGSGPTLTAAPAEAAVSEESSVEVVSQPEIEVEVEQRVSEARKTNWDVEIRWGAETGADLRRAAAGTPPWAHLGDGDFERLAEDGVDGDLLRALDRAGIAASLDELVGLARHGVDGDDIDAMRRAGRADLTADDLVTLARQGIDGDDIADLERVGYGGLSVADLERLARHGVDADDVEELRGAGLEGLSLDDLADLARHGIDGDDIADLRDAGYQDLTVQELVDLARQGVDGDDVAELRDAGLRDLSLDQLADLARHGIDGDEVAELRDAGLGTLSVEELIALSSHGIDGDDVSDLRNAGLNNLTVEELLLLARHGIDGDDLEDAGLDPRNVTVDELVRLAQRGEL
ncbi:MAG: M56 family metallopeptidase [Acidobacteriota bacterium]